MSYSEPMEKIRRQASRPCQPGADGGFSVFAEVKVPVLIVLLATAEQWSWQNVRNSNLSPISHF